MDASDQTGAGGLSEAALYLATHGEAEKRAGDLGAGMPPEIGRMLSAIIRAGEMQAQLAAAIRDASAACAGYEQRPGCPAKTEAMRFQFFDRKCAADCMGMRRWLDGASACIRDIARVERGLSGNGVGEYSADEAQGRGGEIGPKGP